MVLIPPDNEYIIVTIPTIKTDWGIDHPEIVCTITAVARNLIPSANTRVTRKIKEENF